MLLSLPRVQALWSCGALLRGSPHSARLNITLQRFGHTLKRTLSQAVEFQVRCVWGNRAGATDKPLPAPRSDGAPCVAPPVVRGVLSAGRCLTLAPQTKAQNGKAGGAFACSY